MAHIIVSNSAVICQAYSRGVRLGDLDTAGVGWPGRSCVDAFAGASRDAT
jgi:hypothetical protein